MHLIFKAFFLFFSIQFFCCVMNFLVENSEAHPKKNIVQNLTPDCDGSGCSRDESSSSTIFIWKFCWLFLHFCFIKNIHFRFFFYFQLELFFLFWIKSNFFIGFTFKSFSWILFLDYEFLLFSCFYVNLNFFSKKFKI